MKQTDKNPINKTRIPSSIVIVLALTMITVCLIYFNFGLYNLLIAQDQHSADIGIDQNADQACTFKYFPPADVELRQTWDSDQGHDLFVNATHIPENHKINIFRNGDKIETLDDEKNLTYDPDSGDKFIIQQKSEDHNRELNTITINEYN